MATSTPAANAALDREVTAGGSWWVGLALEMPDDYLTSVDEAPIARVELPRTSAAWDDADERTVHPSAPLDFGDATEDFTPVAWVMWNASTGGTPEHAQRIPDVDIPTGAHVALPAASIGLTYP